MLIGKKHKETLWGHENVPMIVNTDVCIKLSQFIDLNTCVHFIAGKFYLKYTTKHEPTTERIIYRKIFAKSN